MRRALCVLFHAVRITHYASRTTHHESVMTRLTPRRCLVRPMALDTKTHIHLLNLCYFFHVSYIPMTRFASNPLRDMPFMREKDKVGHVVDLCPLKRISLRDQRLHFLDMGAVGFDDGMAIHADIHAGDGGVPRFINARMAILAVNFQPPGMFFMAERDRLFRGITLVVSQVVPKPKTPDSQQPNNTNGQNRLPPARFEFNKLLQSVCVFRRRD